MRQHDLRTSHSCTSGACPAPLVELPHELSTITLSPLTPYQFVVGGESPYVRVDFLLSILILSAGYLFLVSHDISCVHVLKIAILRHTYSTVGMRGVTCVQNGV